MLDLAMSNKVIDHYECPNCGYTVPLERIRQRIARFLGSKGGSVTGPSKARAGAAAKAAAARWKGHVPVGGYKKKVDALELKE